VERCKRGGEGGGGGDPADLHDLRKDVAIHLLQFQV
jgi:hypothetical protein